VIELLKSWWEFGLYLIGDTPALKDAIQLYPLGCALGIYWTQGIKRAQRKARWGDREYLTSFELRGLSGALSGAVIAIMAFAFFVGMPLRQVIAHAMLGGASAPLIMWVVIEVLALAGTRWEWARAYAERIKTGDRRRRDQSQPPPGIEERRAARDGDETGEFWSNDYRR
jgi:hypothetical protein